VSRFKSGRDHKAENNDEVHTMNVPPSMLGRLKRALHGTYDMIGGDLAEIRAQCGESSMIPRDELIEVVLDQVYGGFDSVSGAERDEINGLWKALSSADRLEIAQATFVHEYYE
jgi:hypothetical protein